MKPLPRQEASLFSKLFFIWLYPLLWTGRKKTLNLQDDLYEVAKEDKSELLVQNLEKAWTVELLNKNGPSFFRALRTTYGLQYVLLGLTAFVEECGIRIGQPLCLGFLMQYFRGGFTELEGWLFAGGVVFLSMWYVTQHHPFFFALQHNGMKIRVATSALIYKKALKLSLSSLEKTSQGKLINLMSNDVNRLDLSKDFMHYIWIAPCQLIIVTFILWGYFGWVSIVGIALLLLFIPFQSGVGRLFGKYRSQISGKTDTRLRFINQVLKGISAIKVYAWENAFVTKVTNARSEEVKILRKTTLLRSLNQSLYYVACKIVVFVTLLLYFLLGNALTPEKVFVTLALFNNVRMTLTLFLPFGISQFAEIRVAIQRIQNFLELEEQITENANGPKVISNANVSLKGNNDKENRNSSIIVENICAKWNNSSNLALDSISFSVKNGQLLGIIGPIGCGKSSILQVLLKELPISSGKLEINGRIAYTDQEPWIFMGTVRDNILFGKDYEPERYAKVVQDCALLSDFTQFVNGDETWIVDEKSLSGGQRSRISLARAVYSDADIYLLDDPISAVDAKVASHLYENLITKLAKDKIVVFVTHQHQYLQGATSIICLGSNGKIITSGTYQDIQKSGNILLSTTNKEAETNELQPDKSPVDTNNRLSINSSESSTNSQVSQVKLLIHQEGVKPGQGKKDEEILLTEEIGFSLYWRYMKSGSNCLSLTLMIISNIIAQLLFTGSDYWLKIWTKNVSVVNSNAIRTDPKNGIMNQIETDRDLQIGIYSGIIGALLIFSFIRTSSFFGICMNASVNLHNKLFSSLVYTKLQFFEKNPSGRILNRFSQDVGKMDDTLPVVLFDTVEVALQVLGILVVVSLVNPTLTIPAVFVCLSFFFIRRFYLQSAQTIKRLESIARSPILSQLSSTINGLTTIRAYGAENKVQQDFFNNLDQHSSTWYIFLATTRWLGVTVDWVSILYILSVAIVVMVTNSGDADAGLAITSAMSLTGLMQWGVKQSSEAASQMISVERVLEYCDLEPEQKIVTSQSEKLDKPQPQLPKDWPTSGKIQFTDVSLKYGQDSQPVLKHLTFTVESGHKVGIVGRTGAGKSSLISALLRLEEPTGIIAIDGVNHKQVQLHDLRRSISIIPQTPMLFSDTLRNNLDPLGEFKDNELSKVLQDVQLNALSNGLDTQVEEEGLNFSGGQRQLICLGRALLRKSKILILDEATASMDFTSDSLIQETIRSQFVGCTVLVVAHRLNTVLDSDRILVLDSGSIQEYDEPKRLLEDENSALSILLKHAKKSA